MRALLLCLVVVAPSYAWTVIARRQHEKRFDSFAREAENVVLKNSDQGDGETIDEGNNESNQQQANADPSWKLSPSFQAYVDRVRAEMGEQFLEPENSEEGVACPGEPAVDPSRQIRSNQGDSEWMDDW